MKKSIDIKQYSDSIFHCQTLFWRENIRKVVLKKKSDTKFGTRLYPIVLNALFWRENILRKLF